MIKVHFHDKMKEFERSQEGIRTIVTTINEHTRQSDLLFSHLIIDNIDIYEGHIEYMMDKIDKIQYVQVAFTTKEQLYASVQDSLNHYLDRALPVIEQLSAQFYTDARAEVWEELAHLSDGLQWIIGALDSLQYYSEEETAKYYRTLSENLKQTTIELVNVLEVQDTVAIADILQYEIVAQLTEIKQSMVN